MVGLAMAVGVSFSMMALGKASAELSPEDRTAFMLRAFVLTKVASIGFALLIITGITMVVLNGHAIMSAGGKPFMIKLALVLLQILVFGFMQMTLSKVKKAQGGPLMARVPKIGSILLFNGLAIVLLAVLAFH